MTDQSTATATEHRGTELPPLASNLMQSLRAVGYTTAAALADLVDNSIAAKAGSIRILSSPDGSYVSIIDNGVGMNETTLISAMRFGSRDPRETRSANDLGRFGLGLKTASLSQCRRMTVASKRGGAIATARWDVDVCERERKWWLERPTTDELPAEVAHELGRLSTGTAVVWENLDRLTNVGIVSAILDAADHLALVFHRFLAGELVGPFTISLNDRILPTVDPFLEGHVRGQSLHTETIQVEGALITVSPFVLPFPSRLKESDLERAGGRESLRTAHGFYIYRGGRLVVPGGWFRIVPADELIRLARIRVDVPVELDHLWKVDIRKAIAEPPPALRPHLRRIVGDVTLRSRRVYQYKGTPAADTERVPIWKRQDIDEHGARWLINREHPYVRSFLADHLTSPDANMLLRFIENNLPIQDIHIQTVNDQPIAEQPIPGAEELEQAARRIISAFADQPEVKLRMLKSLAHVEPFNRNPEVAQRIAEALRV